MIERQLIRDMMRRGMKKMGSLIVERKNEKIESEYDKGIRDGFQHIVTREMAEYEQ
jgi:hypothetical protein